MSFLNPVNEPVKRFSSTDAGAPQINYNARVAGDVKTVLKACLVTGYGATAGAGWSVVNEVNHVAEFVSPSAAMSDYRLGIDDTSASSTTWYYQYQDARKSTAFAPPLKGFGATNKTHANNGWQLLVTTLGFYFIEIVQSSEVDAKVARLTYFGQAKSAITSANQNNMAFWYFGYSSSLGVPSQVLASDTINRGYNIAGYTNIKWTAANMRALSRKTAANWGFSSVALTAPLYLLINDRFAGQQPGLLLQDRNDANELFGVNDITIAGRPALAISATWEVESSAAQREQARHFLIYVDNWEY